MLLILPLISLHRAAIDVASAGLLVQIVSSELGETVHKANACSTTFWFSSEGVNLHLQPPGNELRPSPPSAVITAYSMCPTSGLV